MHSTGARRRIFEGDPIVSYSTERVLYILERKEIFRKSKKDGPGWAKDGLLYGMIKVCVRVKRPKRQQGDSRAYATSVIVYINTVEKERKREKDASSLVRSYSFTMASYITAAVVIHREKEQLLSFLQVLCLWHSLARITDRSWCNDMAVCEEKKNKMWVVYYGTTRCASARSIVVVSVRERITPWGWRVGGGAHAHNYDVMRERNKGEKKKNIINRVASSSFSTLKRKVGF